MIAGERHYMGSPDYKYNEERVQRLVQDTWLKNRGKSDRMLFTEPNSARPGTSRVLQSGIDYVQVKSMKDIGYFNKNDVNVYMDESHKKVNTISQDAINSEIVQFCTNMFACWLEDYELYVKQAK